MKQYYLDIYIQRKHLVEYKQSVGGQVVEQTAQDYVSNMTSVSVFILKKE